MKTTNIPHDPTPNGGIRISYIPIIFLFLLFACKKQVNTTVKPNLTDNFSGTWYSPTGSMLIITKLTDTPDNITFNIKGLRQVVIDCFQDSNLVQNHDYTGYGENTLLFNNIQLGADGQSFIKLNYGVNVSSISFGNLSKIIHK